MYLEVKGVGFSRVFTGAKIGSGESELPFVPPWQFDCPFVL